jgi:hypothetical protein
VTLTSTLNSGIVLNGTPCNVVTELSPAQSTLLSGKTYARLNLIDALGNIYTKANLEYWLR